MLDFLQAHKDLIQDEKSQALRIDENIRVLIDAAHSKISKEGIDDSGYLVCCPITQKREE